MKKNLKPTITKPLLRERFEGIISHLRSNLTLMRFCIAVSGLLLDLRFLFFFLPRETRQRPWSEAVLFRRNAHLRLTFARQRNTNENS